MFTLRPFGDWISPQLRRGVITSETIGMAPSTKGTLMRTRTSSAVIACAIAAGSIMFSAPVASAAAYCSSDGYTATGLPYNRCTELGNGILYHSEFYDYVNTNINTTYSKTGGSAVSVHLGYSRGGNTVMGNYFTISAGETMPQNWSRFGDYMCDSAVGVLNYSGGTFQTPATHC